MEQFQYNEDELRVLKNFATINPNIIIYPNRFVSINGPKASLVGVYDFEKSYKHEPYGIFDLNEFLSLLSQFKDFWLEVHDKYILVGDDNSSTKVKYNLTPVDLIKSVPVDKLEFNWSEIDKEIEFTFTAENLNTLKKIRSVLASERLFLQSKPDDACIVVTAADKILEDSTNPLTIKVQAEHIKTNDLGDDILYLNAEELKILPGDYEVGASVKGLSFWSNQTFNVRYYIGVFKVD